MSWRGPLLLLAAALAACASGHDADRPAKDDSAMAAQPWQIDPYTHSDEIFVDGASVGYLVTYDAIPGGLVIERRLPTGTRRLFDARFKDVGFFAPSGLLVRHVGRGLEEVGHYALEDGLLAFYGGKARVQLVPLVRKARPTPTEAPAAEGGEGEAAAEGDAAAAADDGSGG
jgi:hypothetical protein